MPAQDDGHGTLESPRPLTLSADALSADSVRHFVLSPSPDPGWLLTEEGVDPAREREVESLFAIGNGYLGARGSIAEGSRFSHPSTFVAGVYVAHGRRGPRLAVLPHWFHIEVSVEDQRLSVETGRVLSHRRRLDLRQGVLWREWRQQDPSGRITRLTSFQFASLADRHLLFQSIEITPENYAGTICLATRPWTATCTDIQHVRRESGGISMRAAATEIGIAGASDQLFAASRPASHVSDMDHGDGRWFWDAGLGEAVRLERIFALFTSHDVANPSELAWRHLASTRARGFAAVVEAHVNAWHERWAAAEVKITADEEAERALRFATYHLISAVNPADDTVSIGARGLTGEAYRGHVFWDTEIYMLPFYVFTNPPAARALLMYRYHTLGAARRKAKAHGYSGALYAWESADTGDEVTPQTAVTPGGRLVVIRTGEQEHHISADVAYGVWQYWRATGEDAFMINAGAEILVETARFWASRAKVEHDGQAHIRHVIGPDEYHEMVDDNAYTNGMAAFNLARAADIIALLDRKQSAGWQQLSVRLDLAEKEVQSWHALAASLATGFDPATKLIEQFAGYFGLEEIDTRDCTTPADACLGAERISRSKVIKQADVVALSAMLWEDWPAEVHEANFRYYEPRTVHGSSLSPALHALVAARLDDQALARRYFRQAAEIDLANNMGNAAGGVHMGALGALWQVVVFGFAGLQLCDNGIALDPHLLPGWRELAFPVQFQGRLLRLWLGADPKRIEVAVDRGDELTIAVLGGPTGLARAGQRFVLRGDCSGWNSWGGCSNDIL
jgi:kojibiose phosphorylase